MTNKESQFFELIRITPMRRGLALSDDEARALYELWAKAPPGSSTIMADAKDKSMRTLVSKGYVRTSPDGVEITDKGREVIVEMVTHVPNALDKGAKMPSYKEIKSKIAKNSRLSLVKKASSGRRTYNHSRRGK